MGYIDTTTINERINLGFHSDTAEGKRQAFQAHIDNIWRPEEARATAKASVFAAIVSAYSLGALTVWVIVEVAK